jgi:hypothetical protein
MKKVIQVRSTFFKNNELFVQKAHNCGTLNDTGIETFKHTTKNQTTIQTQQPITKKERAPKHALIPKM